MKSLKISILVALLLFTSTFIKAQPVLPPSATIDKITNAYLDLKNALVESDGGLAQVKAKKLLAELSSHPESRLKADQQKFLAGYVDKLMFDTRHISESTSISHQREHFSSLSKNMFTVLKKLKLNTYTVYEQYCPMKKAMWISELTAIKNPYYGKQMLACGTTRETL
jgi:hypothetical protein